LSQGLGFGLGFGLGLGSGLRLRVAPVRDRELGALRQRHERARHHKALAVLAALVAVAHARCGPMLPTAE
jgi:hypothetical protein